LNNHILEQLDNFYGLFFPGSYVQRITGNGILEGEMQKAGIDVIVQCPKIGQSFYIDEKIREEEYNDILLEEYSKWEEKVPGWLEKNNKTDYIAYVILPSRLIYMLPYPILRLAYLKNKEKWIREYGRKFAPNTSYSTSNIPVPWEELKRALWDISKQHLTQGQPYPIIHKEKEVVK